MEIGRSLPVSLFLHTLLFAAVLVIGGNGTMAKKDVRVMLVEERELQTKPPVPEPIVQRRVVNLTREKRDYIQPVSNPGDHHAKPVIREQELHLRTGADAVAISLSPGSGQADSILHDGASGSSSGVTIAKATGISLPSGGIPKNAGKETTDNSAEMKRIRMAIENNLIYPYIAIKKQMEGTVKTEFIINQKGLPEEILITGSSGYPVLDEAARNTLVKASPFPALAGRIEIPITFVLKKERGQ